MKWILATPYRIDIDHGIWKAVQEINNQLEFFVSPNQYEHDRSRSYTNSSQWKDYWNHSKHAWQLSRHQQAGIITAFPQLAACSAVRKKLSLRSPPPIIASTFNLGSLQNNIKQTLASSALKHIDKFIVPSSIEKEKYSEYLKLPISRFEFIPLHRPIIQPEETEDEISPFILSMGSANRDYDTLFSAIKDLPYRLIVVCPIERLSHITIPKNVEVRSNLTIEECRKLVQQAKLNIVPIKNQQTASGQVTVIEAMMFNKAVIATNTIGTIDYIEHENSGWLVQEQSVSELRHAITSLWDDTVLREKLAHNAHQYVKNELSYDKTANKINHILQQFC